MTLTILLALFGSMPTDEITGVVTEEVDRAEVNHFYDDEGRHVFDQLIFYDWSETESRFQVRAWRLIKSPSQVPQKNWTSGRYEVIWHDGELTRLIRAKAFHESWTQHDVELIERDYLPKEQRRRLYTPRIEAKTGED